ncbi:ATP-binding protein [Streptomyces sp. NY05-11A]|uniref:ATP-binding protein n=1 Tax=Streptomyces soliscabiei TaxID=588897 RepID=UPI0029A071A5|nr:ATP-binding protein [Streptomyces sp. NY05-11A]MDX2676777.1 ATP-binding protein [Streptomyces sp. NY05-11A]
MKTSKAEQVARELDAFAHWFEAPDPSKAGQFLTLTLFAESPDTARVARDVTAVFLRDVDAGEVVDDARLVISELVGNVVNHALPDKGLARPGGARRIDVTFKVWPKWLFIGVGDEDSSPPLLPLGDAFSPGLAGELSEAVLPDSGRGLLIVQRLAAAVWWRQEDPGGKTIWCRFDRDSNGKDRTHG